MLISWNAMLTSMGWLVGLYPSYTINTWVTMCFYVPSLIVQPLNAVYGRVYPYTKRINSGYLGQGLALALLPLAAEFLPTAIGFSVVCGLVFLAGCSNSLSQSTLFSLAATLPAKATSLIVAGNSVAGLLITGMRLLCLAAFEGSLLESTLAYYLSATCLLVVCM